MIRKKRNLKRIYHMNFKNFITKSANYAKKVAKHPVTKKVFMLLVMFTICLPMMADVTGATGFQEATTTIRGYIPFVEKLIYAIAALVGLMGAASIYIKMNNGDQDIKKSLMMTIGGCVALVALAKALPAFLT